MPDYRRNRVPGGTLLLHGQPRNRRDDALAADAALLRAAVRKARDRRPFHIDAWVVLPDHMHCLWTLPPHDSDFSTRWKEIKADFSRLRPKTEHRSAARVDRGERGVWQRRFWEHTIRDERDYAMHMDYIHFNPVKHGWATHAAEWPFSSFHRCVSLGLYPTAWGGGDADLGEVGERR